MEKKKDLLNQTREWTKIRKRRNKEEKERNADKERGSKMNQDKGKDRHKMRVKKNGDWQSGDWEKHSNRESNWNQYTGRQIERVSGGRDRYKDIESWIEEKIWRERARKMKEKQIQRKLLERKRKRKDTFKLEICQTKL